MIRSALPIIGLVAVCIIFNILTDGNMWNSRKLILNQVYVVLISTVGVFFIMSMGGLDFSQGSIMGISSIVVCLLSGVNMFLAVIGGIVAGAAIGAFNGYFYVNRKIKSFIVTICTMFLFRGFIKYMASNSPVAASMKVYDYDTTPIKLGITILVLAVGFIAFRFTRFGIDLKAIGAGEKAAKFAGIRTDRVKFLIYVLAGAITGLAAFVNIVKNGSATANAGNQLETQMLIALVLGGMPISGGAKVRFENVIVGSLLYIVLTNGLIMMGLTPQAMQLIQGIIFLIFVAIFADRQSISVIK
jgi:ribose transport system permease protein